jgi:Leucine-rich repeat (LRR) protein
VSNLAPLSAMVNLKILDISGCSSVSDLAPLGDLVDLQSLNIRHCHRVSDLAPLKALTNLNRGGAKNKFFDPMMRPV